MNRKALILTFGILSGLLSVFGRFYLIGWLWIYGQISISLFGIIHVFFLIQVGKYFNRLTKPLRRVAWIGVLLFPPIFIFQFDFSDYPGNFYVYEYLTGTNDWAFERYAYYIALVSALAYLVNFVVWRVKLKEIR